MGFICVITATIYRFFHIAAHARINSFLWTPTLRGMELKFVAVTFQLITFYQAVKCLSTLKGASLCNADEIYKYCPAED